MIRYLLLVMIFGLSSVDAFANEPVSTGFFNNIAVGGHDVTGYQQLAKTDWPIEGDSNHRVEWKGANWYFASAEDRQRFLDNPERYAPAYNGFCANALSLGEGLIKTDGEHWAVLDNQLYLFYAAKGAQRWLNGDYKQYKIEADNAWQAALEKIKNKK